MKLDIKVDVLLGDFDGDFDPNYYKEKQYPLEIVHTPDQNRS
jgi:thiamine pyrophosphokinase